MIENDISYKIRGAIYEVYNELDPELLESVYENAMFYELTEMGLKVQKEVPFAVHYKKIKLDMGFRLDLLVEDKVIVEIKSVEKLIDMHHKQLLTYLRITDLRLGILVNFNTDNLKENIFRKVNNL